MDEFKEAYYHKIPCKFNPETGELYGKNWFYEILVDICLWWDVYISNKEEFEITILESLDEDEIEFDLEDED